MTALAELSAVVAGAAARVGPSVVGLGAGWGRGSGVVVAEGRVLTAAHALRREESTLTFQDGRRASARLAAADADADVAVLLVDTGDVTPLAWRPDDAPLVVGDAVVALADPGGRGLRATLGFVSAAGRRFRGPRGRWITGAIEHTAPLPSGSSGGPLVDAEGRLAGINSIRLDGGLILATPADAALRARAERLALGQSPATPRLGVAVATPRAARRLRRAVGLPERDGVLVRAVEDGSAAAEGGLQRGDLIVAAGDRATRGVDDVYAALDALEPGGALELRLVRGTEERAALVTPAPGRS